VEDKSEKGSHGQASRKTMQARPNGPAETSLPERPRPLGVVATQSLNAAGNRADRVVGAWTARAGGRAKRRTPRMCAVCEVRGATYGGRFCSSMCGWASVLGGKVREGRKRDVQTAVSGIHMAFPGVNQLGRCTRELDGG